MVQQQKALLLLMREKEQVLETVVKLVNHKVPIIAGTGYE